MAEKSAPPVSVTCAAVTETGESLGIQKVNHFHCNQVQHKMSKGMIAVQKAVLFSTKKNTSRHHGFMSAIRCVSPLASLRT